MICKIFTDDPTDVDVFNYTKATEEEKRFPDTEKKLVTEFILSRGVDDGVYPARMRILVVGPIML